jgi:hypothetical protein
MRSGNQEVTDLRSWRSMVTGDGDGDWLLMEMQIDKGIRHWENNSNFIELLNAEIRYFVIGIKIKCYKTLYVSLAPILQVRRQ